MRELILIFIAVFVVAQAGASCAANAAPEAKYKIAILDTGYNPFTAGTKLKLCKSGHFDYRTNTATIGATGEHGTKVASIIAEELRNVDYCAVIYQVMNRQNNMLDVNIVDALNRARASGAAAVNLSFVSQYPTIAERKALERLAKGARLFVAAGNDKKNLDWYCDAFPACYDIPNMVVVGATDTSGMTASYSNRGERINVWYFGGHRYGGYGTSFAAPRALSAYVSGLSKGYAPMNIAKQSVRQR